jgi:hypothetical protein
MIQPMTKIMPATKLDFSCTLLVAALPVYSAAEALAVVVFPAAIVVVYKDTNEAAVSL